MAKISDFGLSRPLGGQSKMLTKTYGEPHGLDAWAYIICAHAGCLHDVRNSAGRRIGQTLSAVCRLRLESSACSHCLADAGWYAVLTRCVLLLLASGCCFQCVDPGTITHMPPETLEHGVTSKAADVFSFGVLLWQMLATSRCVWPHAWALCWGGGPAGAPYCGSMYTAAV